MALSMILIEILPWTDLGSVHGATTKNSESYVFRL
jgi:hypothetical protein